MTDPINGLGIRIAQIPSSVQNDPLSGVYIVAHLKPATAFSQRIEITNTTSAPLEVIMYPGAATSTGNEFTPGAPGATNLLTEWTRVVPNTATIPAHGVISALVTIAVPEDAQPGTNFGVVWASIATSQTTSGMVSVNRVGIRMYDPVVGTAAITKTSTTSSIPWLQTHSPEVSGLGVGLITLFFLTVIYAQTSDMRRWRKLLKNQNKISSHH